MQKNRMVKKNGKKATKIEIWKNAFKVEILK